MKTIQQRKQNWIDLFEKKRNRVYKINIAQNDMDRPMLWAEKKQERIDFALRKYEKLQKQILWLDDDTVPYLDMITGTEIFAEAFGAKVYKGDDNNPCAIPFINSPLEAGKIKIPDLYDSSLSVLFEIADAVYDKAGSDAIMRLVDLQTPIDIAAIMWEKTDFYASLITDPQVVLELCIKIRTLLTKFLDEWFKRYKKEFVAHYPTYYMPYGISISEDEIGAVSPRMFNDFFIEELAVLSKRYGQIGVHCCADSEHQWENLKQIPQLKLLNLHRDAASITRSIDCFKDFTAQMPNAFDSLGIENTIGHLNNNEGYIALWEIADNREEALRILDRWHNL